RTRASRGGGPPPGPAGAPAPEDTPHPSSVLGHAPNTTPLPSATNAVNQNHTFTVTVLQNAGTGGGFVAAAGATVTVTLTNHFGAVASPAGPFSGTPGANGQLFVRFTSAPAGEGEGGASGTGWPLGV